MAKQEIVFHLSFHAPVDEIFGFFQVHDNYNKIWLGKFRRVIDAKGDNPDGLGSTRSIKIGLSPAFEETIIGFEPNKLIEYTVSKGSPVKNHLGRMVFSESNGVTTLNYRIEFESKIPGLGPILKLAVEQGLGPGLKKMAARYN